MIGYLAAEVFATELMVTAYGNLLRTAFLPEDHERRVDRDARDPSSEIGSALELPHVNKRSQ